MTGQRIQDRETGVEWEVAAQDHGQLIIRPVAEPGPVEVVTLAVLASPRFKVKAPELPPEVPDDDWSAFADAHETQIEAPEPDPLPSPEDVFASVAKGDS